MDSTLTVPIRAASFDVVGTLCRCCSLIGEVLGVRRNLRLLPQVNPCGLTDGELIGRSVDDESSLRELVQRHQRSLAQLANSMLRNRSDAEEAVQDTFVAAHRAAGSFRGESSGRAWLHAICYRQCLTQIRRKRLQVVPIDAADRIGAEPDLVTALAIEAALLRLSEEHRAAFTLVDILGFSREEAAVLVGIPGNTMRARSARARVLIADLLIDSDDRGVRR